MIWELSLNKALKNMPGASPCTYNKVVTIPANTLNDPPLPTVPPFLQHCPCSSHTGHLLGPRLWGSLLPRSSQTWYLGLEGSSLAPAYHLSCERPLLLNLKSSPWFWSLPVPSPYCICSSALHNIWNCYMYCVLLEKRTPWRQQPSPRGMPSSWGSAWQQASTR